MKRLLDWFLLTNSFTACCAMGLCMATERLVNDIPIPWFNKLDLLVFGCTLLVYNLHQAIKKRQWSHVGLPTITRHHQLAYGVVSMLGLVIASFGIRALSEQMITIFLVLGLISFAYSLPLLPFKHKNKKRLRDFGWIKILSLAGVWTVVTSVLPMLYWQKHISHYPLEILIRFLFIFTLCIIFDIRDVKDDIASNIRSFPQIVGLGNSYRVINVALILFILAGVAQYMRYPAWYRLVAVIVTAIATRMVAEYLKKNPAEKAYLLYADGMMMLYAALVLVL